jgi:hypothetical protein
MSSLSTKVLEEVQAANEHAKVSVVKMLWWRAFNCQVCAPKTMSAEEVEKETNLINVCGTEKGWTISSDEKMAPVTCAYDDSRQHWILEA